MRLLLTLWLLFLCTQDIRGSTALDSSIETSNLEQKALSKELLGLVDLWNSVKHSAINAWESVQNIAKHSEERMSTWIQSVKSKAKNINTSFKKSLQDFKNQIKAIIANVKITGDLVKQCIQKEQEAIEEILRQIVKSVSTCISQGIQQLSVLEVSSTYLIDKAEFITNIESKLYLCLSKDDIEKCLNNVRKITYEQLEREEEDILKNKDETRTKTDHILNIIASCASNGLIEASSAVTNTTIQVIKCVTKG